MPPLAIPTLRRKLQPSHSPMPAGQQGTVMTENRIAGVYVPLVGYGVTLLTSGAQAMQALGTALLVATIVHGLIAWHRSE